ncbi:MAG: tRNA (adenosine(37)-N6)-dimethylallyltransferase MiaA [Deltaproteobacteria bacterium CG_4_10_14_3_um_filter_60_8]|nr:MAG: tRNA (adenosine(37)-N6)-dimethylallyltransferase MiaA [Desulfobacterales bacterium CG2_30_60_27]PIP43797.1 MAG: tRNA (adenosine(37)-N6)-dimethylallyltransferase MiaA [Deltaproteobacteria bacterium CG23_combo_of_CG06-09_8_20_14_all_60_8]PIY23152.1 MAG: tRNA (adenosine(37)-N6)-dimethylallyltransferase MiaA [Deltaproteobacteria bacterium CG_4_10_14_3_um_filter_60_8]
MQLTSNNQTPPYCRGHIDLPVVVIAGPTAVGKTALALAIAERSSGEIVGADSMQVYRHMDIGTAKPTREEMGRVRHHLIDVADPDEQYQAARYAAEALQACFDITARGKVPLVVGGTGLYIHALIHGVFAMPLVDATVRADLRARLAKEGREALYQELQQVDPLSAARIHANDTQRLLRGLEIFLTTGISWSRHLSEQVNHPNLRRVLRIGLTCDRETLYARINQRVEGMMAAGLLEEVRHLLALGYDGELTAMQSLGYRHMLNHIAGRWPLKQAIALLAQDTRRFAKRQFTWFGRDPDLHWYGVDQEREIWQLVTEFLGI